MKRWMNLSLAAGCLLLQGCESVKSTLGLERNPPDEFALVPDQRPLDMPPDFSVLPAPRPGTPSPKEVQAKKEKHKQLFGEKPGAKTPGQKELLKLGKTEGSKHSIRQEVDVQAEKEASSKKNPVLDLFKGNPPAGQALDPFEETTALQTKGIPQRIPVEIKPLQDK